MRGRWVAMLLVAMGPATAARAIISNGPEPDSQYIAYGAEPRFDAVGSVSYAAGGFVGSGTLIGGDWVLTAGHIATAFAQDTDAAFTLGDTTYGVSDIRLHPGYNPSTLANDIALIQLSTPSSVAPAGLIDVAIGDSYLDAPVILVGFGESVRDLHDVGTKRAANSLNIGFDANNLFLGGVADTFAGMVSSGDSGGSTWYGRALDDGDFTSAVVGIHSLVTGDELDVAGDVPVAKYRSFIDTWVTGVTWLDAEPVPEPSAGLTVLGIALLMLCRTGRGPRTPD